MPITKKSRVDAFNSMKAYLQTLTTSLTDFNTGSVLLSMFDTVAAEIEQLYNTEEQIENAAFISTATGADLDKKVADFTLTRRGATVSSGILTFGRTNAGTMDYRIVAGTVAGTSSTSTTAGVQFETIEEVILPAGSLTVTANARCRDFGIVGNAAANSITILPSPPAGIEFVNNYTVFANGQDEETDEELRNRLTLFLNSLARGTKLALESAALSITGVSSVSIVENDPSPGYVNIYIADASGTATPAVIALVEDVIEDYRPCAVICFVLSPVVQFVDVICYISVDVGYETSSVTNAVSSAISTYLSSLKLGEDVNRAKLIETIINVAGVIDLDTTVEEKVINENKLSATDPIVDEPQTSLTNTTLTLDNAAFAMAGVWLAEWLGVSNVGHNGTNYYTGGSKSNKNILLGTPLPIVDEQQTSVSTTQVDVNYSIDPVNQVDGVYLVASHGGGDHNYWNVGSCTVNENHIYLDGGDPLPGTNTIVYITYTEASGENTQTNVIINYDRQYVETTYNIADVEGIWLQTDINHALTNYWIDGSWVDLTTPFGADITVGTTLPSLGGVDSVYINYWKDTGQTGLLPYDNVTIPNGSIARPRTISINILP